MGDFFAKIIKAGQESGDLRTDISIEILAELLEVMHSAAVMNWLLDQVNNPLLDSLSNAYDLFLNGACAHVKTTRTCDREHGTSEIGHSHQAEK